MPVNISWRENVLLVESPFQLLSAYEAIESYSLQSYKLLIRLSRKEHNDTQLLKLSNQLFPSQKNITYYTIGAAERTLRDLGIIFLLWLFVQVYSLKLDLFFVGNIDSKLIRLVTAMVPRRKLVVLDDGTTSLIVQKRSTSLKYYNFFTMLYSLKSYSGQTIRKHKFSAIRKILLGQVTATKGKSLFIGSCLCECDIILQQKYIELVAKVAADNNTEEMLYIPHRFESEEKLSLLEEIKGVSIERIDYPIELFCLYHETIPENIISFYSGALISLKILYGNLISVCGVKFDYSDSKLADDLDSIYSELEQYITIKELGSCND